MSDVIPTIVAQHAGEAAFLWLLRDAAVSQPHYKIADLAALDERLEAHLDGLRIAGQAGWDAVVVELEGSEHGEMFVAAALAFPSGDVGRIDAVLKKACASSNLMRAVVSALGWCTPEEIKQPLKQLLSASSPALRRIGIAAAAVHRLVPRDAVVAALRDPDPLLRARALKAVGELGLVGLLNDVRAALTSSDAAVRFWGAWSAALLAPADRDVVRVLQAAALDVLEYRSRAVQMLMRRVDPAAGAQWLARCFNQPLLARLAVEGFGALGDPAAVPTLLTAMKTPGLARLAGEAFTMITGAQIVYESLEGAAPPGFDAGPTEDPTDENVALDPDENLPWPDPTRVAVWWNSNQSKFTPGRRYLAGLPITTATAAKLLATGYQRQRMAAALELAIADPGKALFEVRAPGSRQLRKLTVSDE